MDHLNRILIVSDYLYLEDIIRQSQEIALRVAEIHTVTPEKFSAQTLDSRHETLLLTDGYSISNAELLQQGDITFTKSSFPLECHTVIETIHHFIIHYQEWIALDNDITLNIRTKSIQAGKVSINLTEKEVDILRILAIAMPEAVERNKLFDSVWDYHHNAETRTMEAHLYRLRQKLEPLNISILLRNNCFTLCLNNKIDNKIP